MWYRLSRKSPRSLLAMYFECALLEVFVAALHSLNDKTTHLIQAIIFEVLK